MAFSDASRNMSMEIAETLPVTFSQKDLSSASMLNIFQVLPIEVSCSDIEAPSASRGEGKL